jgi:hypothetical protein
MIRVGFRSLLILLLLKMHFYEFRGLYNILNITSHSCFLLCLIKVVIIFIIFILVFLHEVVVWKLVQNVFTVIHFFFYFIFFGSQIVLLWNLFDFNFCNCLKYRLILSNLIMLLIFILLRNLQCLEILLSNLDFFKILILNSDRII